MVQRSVFRDAYLLSPEYLPHQIPHRDPPLKMLELYFQGVVESATKTSQVAIVTGPNGSGKTMLAKKLLESIPRKAQLHGNLVKTLHVNCRIDRTLQAVLVRALRSLGQSYPSRGYSFEELLTVLVDELKSSRTHLVVVFDEVDSLIASDQQSLYIITRLREVAPGCVSSLLISKTTDYLKSVDMSTLSSLQRNEVALEPYSSDQLLDILSSRERMEAFHDGCVGENSLELAADVAGQFGDARYALELILRAGMLADSQESPRVLPEHVRGAKASLPPQFNKEELRYLTRHQKLILMALSKILKKDDVRFVSMGEVEKSYGVLCESLDVSPNHHTQVWSDVNELSRKGIVETELSGKGRRGRTTMIGLDLVSAKELMGALEKELAPGLAA
jgi:archaeal cell division control protein 6